MSRTTVAPLADGDLLSVPGWTGSAVHCGLKADRALDLTVVSAAGVRTAAGVFTRNQLPAAPVRWCRRQLAAQPRARSLVINSGNANAMTGPDGDDHARQMAERLAVRCGGPALVLSTGVIGVLLPVDQVVAGIDEAAAKLSPGAGSDVAEAMRTTDTFAKRAAVRLELGATADGGWGNPITVGGVAKGSGMIHPDMATMLAVIATDAELDPAAAQHVLQRAVDASFHEITVDGDTSTNDAVLLFAGGAPMKSVGLDDPRLATIEQAVTAVADGLAQQIVRDGEGATRVMDLRVTGADSAAEARQVARAVADSLLVKTALAGGDANWGRMLAAAANAGVPLEADRLALSIGGVRVFDGGGPTAVDEATLAAAMSHRLVHVELELGVGQATARMRSSDLTKGYVAINSEYTT